MSVMPESEEESSHLRRTLSKRHIIMMSLGGTIGTGLFIGVSAPLQMVGGLGTVIAYLLAGMVMMATMFCLGELSCSFPHAGSFQHYALMFIRNPFWSYLIGWLYWLSWVFSLAADLTAGSLIAHQFFPSIPIYLLCLILIALLTIINLFSARLFGECEYWLAGIKIFAIILFILVGGYLIWHNFYQVGVVPTLKTAQGWFPHGIAGLFICMTIVTYSFQGVELIGNAAGESIAPQQVLPKVIYGIGLRIILFYVLAIVILAVIYPYGQSNTVLSPFIWVFDKVGLPSADTFMLLVIFSAALSAANSAIYASSRMLWSMSKDGLAPKLFMRVSRQGVPALGILFTIMVSLVSLLTKYVSAQTLYLYLISSTGQVGCFAWIVIAWCQYQFRRGIKQGIYPASQLVFRSPLFPAMAFFSIIMNIIIIIGSWFNNNGGVMLLAEIILILIIMLMYRINYHHKQNDFFIGKIRTIEMISQPVQESSQRRVMTSTCSKREQM